MNPTTRDTPGNSALSLPDILAEELREAGTPCADDSTDSEQRLRALHRHIHGLETKRSALCLSGGGIRSASFGLGVLQALARAGLLGKFDYLSTVSGGGYIGGWLTAWIQNHPRGREGVFEDLAAPPQSTTEPERAPIRHLRAFSNFLTPRLGILSSDAWTLAATVLRNILLNWIVLVSWLGALLLIPRLSVFAVLACPAPSTLIVLLAGSFISLAIATAYAGIDLPSLGNARWPQRRFVFWWLAPMITAAALFCGWWAGYRNTIPDAGPFMASIQGLLLTQIFVGLASGAGCLGSAVFVGFRDRSGNPFALDRLKRLIGMVLVTVVLTGALTGFFAWSIAAWVFPDPASVPRYYSCFAVPLLLALFFSANCLFNGLTSWWANDQDREWWGRATGWLIAAIFGWALLHSLVLWAPPLVAQIDIEQVWKWLLAAFGGVLGIVAAILGFSKGTGAQRAGSPSLTRTRLLAALAVAFFVLLSCVLSLFLDAPGGQLKAVKNLWGGDWWGGQMRAQFAQLLICLGILAAVGVAMGFFINVNKFSLHAVYRSRVIRAFLGASRCERRPHWFTGFDPNDNIKFGAVKPGRPFHVVNIALNLVGGSELAWQERKAASFTVSRLHAGSWTVDYRPSDRYGGGISMGTALAISGAAASPNQGYNSSPLVAFLMTLFNLRLGWWLGNPGHHGRRTWKRNGPLHAALPLFNEALGNTTDTYPYVYLSDGGHFENLGLYEMVLRRCRHIVAVDAGCDSEYVFQDLGNAIRKIRIDFGIPIDIQVVSPKKEGATASYFAIGTIRYSAVDGPGTDGKLLYIKPVICGQEPADVAHYAAAHPDFPHESTADQWFSESQLESYRALGAHAVRSICGNRQVPDVVAFLTQLEESLVAKTDQSAVKTS